MINRESTDLYDPPGKTRSSARWRRYDRTGRYRRDHFIPVKSPEQCHIDEINVHQKKKGTIFVNVV